jgi:hypothetical protein
MPSEPDPLMQHEQQPTSQDPTPLQPALQDAERLLRESLGQVCSTDPTRADTGEMIRLDEMLAIAGEAAKRAVSIRRRMRQEGRAVPRSPRATRGRGSRSDAATGPVVVPGADALPADAAATGLSSTDPLAGAAPPADAATPAPTSAVAGAHPDAPDEHRTFRDARGVVWSVWAVHPQQTRGRRAGLRGSFLHGWLAFVCEVEKRRLSPVPEGWTTLDDAALEQLCGTAEAARSETPTRRMPRIEEAGEASS